jgi:four helix bundle protein
MLINDDARMTNDEGILINDEARMTNDEGMTKHEDSRELDKWSWLDNETASVREEPDTKPLYDLEQRTARFGEAIIDFAKKIPLGPLTDRIISQLVGAGTSVGANYDEADDAVSKREFLKYIGTCKKEARESKHFLRMAARAVPELKSEARELWLEARALHLIFAKIWRSGKNQRRGSNYE